MHMHALDYAPEEFKTTLPLWTSNYIKDKDGDDGKTAIDNAIAIEVCQKKMMEALRHWVCNRQFGGNARGNQWMPMMHHEIYHHLHYDYATSNDTNCVMMALLTFMMEDHWKMRVQSQHSAPTSGRLLSRE